MVTLHLAGAASAKALVLVHAFPLSSAMYHDAAAHLLHELPKLCIVTVDLPGFGDAPYLARWTLAEAMADLHAQLVNKGITSVSVGGVSMGGYAALAYCKQFPKQISSVILSNTKAEADTDEGKAGREKLALDVEAKGLEPIYGGLMLKLIAKKLQASRPALVNEVKAMISEQQPRAIAAASRAMARRDDSTALLMQIDVPTLVIAGTDDELIPEAVTKSMTDNLPHATYAPMNGHGHLCVTEDSVAWSALVARHIR